MVVLLIRAYAFLYLFPWVPKSSKILLHACNFSVGATVVACTVEICGGWWRRYAIGKAIKVLVFLAKMLIDAVVGRKLAEKGYNRSAKKCKEKFENVHKYYKRTKESRAGRNDGKTYRFFTQLEALHGTGAAPASVASQVPPAISSGVSGAAGPSAVRVPPEPLPAVSAGVGMPMTTVGYPSFSTSNTDDYTDEDDSDDEGTEELVGDDADERRKRKRVSEGDGGSGKMMRFFEGLMKQVMERQEAMQQRFLEAIEKREQERMIREEAWRRQEMTRLAREQEILTQERAMAASRDAAVLSFIQKITGQTIPMPSIAAPTINAMPPPSHPKPPPHATPIASASLAPQPPASQTPPPQQQQPSPQQQKSPMPATPQTPAPQQQSTDIVMTLAETTPHADTPVHEGSGGVATSSRWPKAEVHALIQLRSNLDTRYQETGPKGPLWEEISAGMRRMGYNRNAKRCKEKWENINKYFKKVKESNKKRPEDSKTCPYFHQLDALYRNKAAQLSSSTGAGAVVHANASSAPQEMVTVVTAAAPISQTPPPPTTQPSQFHLEAKNGGSSNSAGTGAGTGNGGCASEHGSRGMQTQASNGSAAASRFVGEGGGGAASAAKKPEDDIMKEMMEQRQPQPQQPQAVVSGYNRIDGAGSNNMDDDDDDDDDEEDDDYDEDDDEDDDGNKMQYEIQFQRQQQHQQQQHPNAVRSNAGTGGGNPPGTAAPSTAAAPTTTAGSFLGMVQ